MAINRLRNPNLVIVSAWLAHAVSWFLPVVKLGGSHSGLFGPLRGWIAFRAALSPVWPYEDMHIETWYYSALSVASAITTILFIIGSPWVVRRGSWSALKAYGWVATGAFILNSHWYISFGSDREGLSAGYFLWWLSFGLLAIGLFGLSSHCKLHEYAEPESGN